MFDKDRDGYLRQDEFRLVCELIDPDIDDDLAKQMFTQFDVDERERIDTLEFSHAIEYWKTTDPNVMQKLAMVSPNLVLEGYDQQTSPRESRDGAEEYGQPEVASW